MPRPFEESIVRQCAATLAGHKCGSLFSYRWKAGEQPEAALEEVNALLMKKGICAVALRNQEGVGLIYVYRVAAIQRQLARPEVRLFLQKQGYPIASAAQCLAYLGKKLALAPGFPHEIGVFLDYPLSDVIAFIENKGMHFRQVGYWKVYSNEAEALRIFALYTKCREVYLKCYRRGFGVERLTVAA